MNKVNLALIAVAAVLLVGLGAAFGFLARLQSQAPQPPAPAPAAAVEAQEAGDENELEEPGGEDAPEEAEDDDLEPLNPNPTKEEVSAVRKSIKANRDKISARYIEQAKADGWYDDFDALYARAETEHRPFVVVWTHKGCQHCKRLEKATGSARFKAYLAERGIVLCRVRGVPGDAAQERAHKFAKSAQNELKNFPYVACRWVKEDGTETLRNFTGRRQDMGNPPFSMKLEDVLARAIDAALGLQQ